MKPNVYYNEECSVCRFEINHYKKKSNLFEWSDINNNYKLEKEIKKTKNQLLRRIHVKNNDEILIGIDAFIFIWSRIPPYHIVAKILKLPFIYQLGYILYECLAFLLYLKNYKQFKKNTY